MSRDHFPPLRIETGCGGFRRRLHRRFHSTPIFSCYLRGETAPRPSAAFAESSSTGCAEIVWIRFFRKETKMDNPDSSVLDHIQALASEEHRLYQKESLTDQDDRRLHEIQIQLDQCWDFLRQRQALRDAGKDPRSAKVRPPDIVEKYEQ
jgi:Protein of unknown function (DUF2630)